ncbi:hypothetical protein BIV18_03675 [Peptoniphilus porci]|uniref:Transmembrane protein n=1 Tax=Peptoniphilus porci TaxID=2652280 RepID=A0A1U7LZ61_9FIRM|nr:hypothetical protein BIV18_03675 [Peptoniphilus porci]
MNSYTLKIFLKIKNFNILIHIQISPIKFFIEQQQNVWLLKFLKFLKFFIFIASSICVNYTIKNLFCQAEKFFNFKVIHVKCDFKFIFMLKIFKIK